MVLWERRTNNLILVSLWRGWAKVQLPDKTSELWAPMGPLHLAPAIESGLCGRVGQAIPTPHD